MQAVLKVGLAALFVAVAAMAYQLLGPVAALLSPQSYTQPASQDEVAALRIVLKRPCCHPDFRPTVAKKGHRWGVYCPCGKWSALYKTPEEAAARWDRDVSAASAARSHSDHD